jgi:hypothetical protein
VSQASFFDVTSAVLRSGKKQLLASSRATEPSGATIRSAALTGVPAGKRGYGRGTPGSLPSVVGGKAPSPGANEPGRMRMPRQATVSVEYR